MASRLAHRARASFIILLYLLLLILNFSLSPPTFRSAAYTAAREEIKSLCGLVFFGILAATRITAGVKWKYYAADRCCCSEKCRVGLMSFRRFMEMGWVQLSVEEWKFESRGDSGSFFSGILLGGLFGWVCFDELLFLLGSLLLFNTITADLFYNFLGVYCFRRIPS